MQSACVFVYIQLSPSHAIHVGGCDWSSGDRIIYRIFAQRLAGRWTTGAL